MARSDGLIHKKLPPDAVITTRHPLQPETSGEEQVQAGFESLGLEHLGNAIEALSRAAENRSFVVDEYNSAAITGAGSSASVTVLPTYEYMPEKIEAIIITGPAGTITLQLGDRLWALTIPATGILVIAPIAILLSRMDTRALTAASAGTYTLELCGIADRRFST